MIYLMLFISLCLLIKNKSLAIAPPDTIYKDTLILVSKTDSLLKERQEIQSNLENKFNDLLKLLEEKRPGIIQKKEDDD